MKLNAIILNDHSGYIGVREVMTDLECEIEPDDILERRDIELPEKIICRAYKIPPRRQVPRWLANKVGGLSKDEEGNIEPPLHLVFDSSTFNATTGLLHEFIEA